DDHLAFTTNLGAKTGQISTIVETTVFWHHGWLLHLHHYDARQPVTLTLGGFALPLHQPDASQKKTLSAWAHHSTRGTVLQPLGDTPATPDWDPRLHDTTPRRHTHAPYHVTPVLRTARHQGPGWIGALSWTGAGRHAARPWMVQRADAGHWELRHPHHGPWTITHDALPAFPI